MLVPIPEDLETQLEELNSCGDYVDDDQYNHEERVRLEKLKTLGLVALGWVVTPAGRQRLLADRLENGRK